MDIALFHVAAPYPGTPFFFEVVKNKWFRPGTRWEQVDMDKGTVLDYPNMPAERLLYWQKKAFREWAFRPGPAFTYLKDVDVRLVHYEDRTQCRSGSTSSGRPRMKARRLGEAGKKSTHQLGENFAQLVDNRWFALTDLLLVIMSAAAWMLIPRFGIGFSLIALLPWVLRFLAGHLPFQRTPFDWLIAIFLATAWVSYWAAYDKSAAGIKFWLIVSAVLLYYALSAQPKQNLVFLSFLSFCFALALSFYFCLTYDFAGSGGRFAIWWMNHRPHVDWPAIHPDYVSGLILISTILAFYWLWNASKKSVGSAAVVMQLFLLLGMGMVALVFVLTLSRGIEVIGLGVLGLWILWRVSTLSGSNVRSQSRISRSGS